MCRCPECWLDVFECIRKLTGQILTDCWLYSCVYITELVVNSSPGQNGRHFADDIFKCILNEKFCSLIRISCIKRYSHSPINSFAPRYGSKIIQNSCSDTCAKIALGRMSQNQTHEQSTLVQVMVWCRQAPSHCLSQICAAVWRH